MNTFYSIHCNGERTTDLFNEHLYIEPDGEGLSTNAENTKSHPKYRVVLPKIKYDKIS